jgi:hypothetical protein
MATDLDPERLRKQREELRAQNPALFEQVSEILFRHDPIGVNFGDNTDEYEPEAGTILARIPGARSTAAVRSIIHEEFVSWFGEIAGTEDRYTAVADEILAAYQGQ